MRLFLSPRSKTLVRGIVLGSVEGLSKAYLRETTYPVALGLDAGAVGTE